MITEQIIREAEAIADELRQRGEAERARAIDIIVEAVRNGNSAPPATEPAAPRISRA